MTVVVDEAPPETEVAAPVESIPEPKTGFHLRLGNFEGPFDLLLQLISQRRLDVTEVALHQVTDEFISYTKQLAALPAEERSRRGEQEILDQTTEFLVVAATLLDLKTARLLPSGEVEDAEDLALLEARDLLFARLLQYRAFKQVAVLLGELEAAALQRYPRAVGLEERYASLLPEVELGVDAAGFAEIAAAVFRPKPVPTVGLDHLHTPKMSVVEHARRVLAFLRARGKGTWVGFGELTADCENTLDVVIRFIALLELYRQKMVEFDQPEPLGPLAMAWTGDDDNGGDPLLSQTSDEDYD